MKATILSKMTFVLFSYLSCKKILLKEDFSIRCLEIFTFQQDIYYRIFTLTTQSYEAKAG